MLVRPARSDDLPAVARLAAALVRMHHHLDPQRFMLNDLYVDAAARRRGIARALVDATLAWLREHRAPRVVLLSAWQNPDAHAFFEAIGFRRTMVEMTAELGP